MCRILLLPTFIVLLMPLIIAENKVCLKIYKNGAITTICKPICSDQCSNGICQHNPVDCFCNKGKHLENGRCQYDCHEGCPANAECRTGTNICFCKNGYRKVDDSCKPKCSKMCGLYMTCTKPEICSCDLGYNPTGAEGRCEAMCEPTCGDHGRCIATNICKCDEGYKWYNDLQEHKIRVAPGNGKCTPICTKGCGENAMCIGPDVCGCVQGYYNNSGKCEPKCSQECKDNEYCHEPELCRCRQGYYNDTGICAPICMKGCAENAFCISTDQCRCYKGFKLTNDKCEPICKLNCGMYATCVAPNHCICNVGFHRKVDGSCIQVTDIVKNVIETRQVIPVADETKTEAAVKDASKKCLRSVNLIVMDVHIDCDSSSFLIYLLYATYMSLLLVCVFLTYKTYGRFKHHCNKNPQYQRPVPVDYVITYQPSSNSNDVESYETCERIHELSCESPPPSYYTLTKNELQ